MISQGLNQRSWRRSESRSRNDRNLNSWFPAARNLVDEVWYRWWKMMEMKVKEEGCWCLRFRQSQIFTTCFITWPQALGKPRPSAWWFKQVEALFYAFTLGLTVSILVAAVILRKPPKVWNISLLGHHLWSWFLSCTNLDLRFRLFLDLFLDLHLDLRFGAQEIIE